MSELKEITQRPERAYLVGIQADRVQKSEGESLLAELGGLASSLGLEVAGSCLARLRERTAAFLLGSGKVEEIVAAAKDCGADSIVFDQPLSPTQQRNWEERSGLKAYDRNEVIIRIFASRALTKEAALQVELAQLEYSLPRLAHSYDALSRQRGGRYGTKGSGEQKKEIDRREIELRIRDIEGELKDVRKERGVQRARREKASVPRAAIVGYTNSGKSSLLNALANADVLAQDKLFATLDPTTRRIALRKGGSLLLTDTVGFVRNLPHHLVEAFKATLEEATAADLLIEVVDCFDPEAPAHMATTDTVLREIGAGEVPRVLVLNKIDLVTDSVSLDAWRTRCPEATFCSVKTGVGLTELSAAVEDRLTSASGEIRVRIPDAEYPLVALLHREASILGEGREDDGATILRVRLPERLVSRFEKYRIQ
jgi:GTP-binding protein HflX